jgi:hypothetical protein
VLRSPAANATTPSAQRTLADPSLFPLTGSTKGDAYATAMRQVLPFTRENRPWLSSDCIERMNLQFMDCLSKVPPEFRDSLREWAAVKVEMGACYDKPDIVERCHLWGDKWIAEQFEKQLEKLPPFRFSAGI